MAVNAHNSSNVMVDGYGNEIVGLSAPANYVTITAGFGGLLFSSDKAQTFISVPSGTHSFRIGITNQLQIRSSGEWQIIARLS